MHSILSFPDSKKGVSQGTPPGEHATEVVRGSRHDTEVFRGRTKERVTEVLRGSWHQGQTKMSVSPKCSEAPGIMTDKN